MAGQGGRACWAWAAAHSGSACARGGGKQRAQGAGRRVQGAGTHLLRCWVARAHTRVRAPVRELLQEPLQEACAPKQVTLLNCCAHKRRPVDPSI